MRTGRRIATTAVVLVCALLAGCRRSTSDRPASDRTAQPPVTAVNHVGPTAREGAAALGRTLAQIACPVALRTDEAGRITCAACPGGSDFAPRADDPASLHEGRWTLTDTVLGTFTAPGQDEAVLHADGCESHASGMGGDFLLRRNGGQWRVVRYVHALPGQSCQALRMRGGRDALLCQTSDMHQGIIEDAVGLVLIEDKPASEEDDGSASVLLYTTDESEMCAEDRAGSLTVHVGSVKGVDLLPPGPEGLRDVRVRVKLGMLRYTKRHGSDEACPPMQTKEYVAVFRNQGDHLQADSGADALRALVPRYEQTLQVGQHVAPAIF